MLRIPTHVARGSLRYSSSSSDQQLTLQRAVIAAISTALLFTFIHWHKGFWQCFIVFTIGLMFCLAKSRIGMWPLMMIDSAIDLASDLFVRQWPGYVPMAKWLIYGYLAICVVLLFRTKRQSDATRQREGVVETLRG